MYQPRPDGMSDEYDVLVVGSGAGGMVAALRAHDLGLRAAIIEKAPGYGGTSATSGGFVWIPNHGRGDSNDSREAALAYLAHVCRGEFRQDRVEAYVDGGPDMVRWLDGLGISLDVIPFPDYFRDAPGATDCRMIGAQELDGTGLGAEFAHLREQPFTFKLFNRYALDLAQSFALTARPRGWRRVAFKLMARYWLDLRVRRHTARDRRLTLGAALVGRLRKAMMDRGIPLFTRVALVRLEAEHGRTTGVIASRNGQEFTLGARHAVVLAAGGFEQNQAMRDRHLPVATDARWSQTPRGANVGDAIIAGQEIGAAVESMDCFWWAPSMQLPSQDVPNLDVVHQMWLDHKHPHSFCVNRQGVRFVNEGCSYDRFGIAMIEDQQRTGTNVPCWMIFDADYRRRYSAGGIMPSIAMPDRKIPPNWWDHYIFRADSLKALAAKLLIDPATLESTAIRFNGFAEKGYDEDFERGSHSYDRFFGERTRWPNPCLAPVARAPFYAVRVDLGDLGGKGGLKADSAARVLDQHNRPLPGLFAIGNCSGAPFGNAYPGAGTTLGAAMVFAFLAANRIAHDAADRVNNPCQQHLAAVP